jgi:hypothetical protein
METLNTKYVYNLINDYSLLSCTLWYT